LQSNVQEEGGVNASSDVMVANGGVAAIAKVAGAGEQVRAHTCTRKTIASDQSNSTVALVSIVCSLLHKPGLLLDRKSPRWLQLRVLHRLWW
jgi:hypothetical protein